MNQIEHQLNKTKPFKEIKKNELSAKITREIVEIITQNQQQDIRNAKIAMFMTTNQMLGLGFGLLKPLSLVILQKDIFEDAFIQNIENFHINCDLIQTSKWVFIDNCFDFAIVGPELDKAQETSTVEIEKASKLTSRVYTCFPKEHKRLITQKFLKAIEIGEISMNVQISNHYKSGVPNIKTYVIFEINV